MNGAACAAPFMWISAERERALVHMQTVSGHQIPHALRNATSRERERAAEHERIIGDMSGASDATHHNAMHQPIDPEFATYLRTYQPSETPQHKSWRHNVITLWNELNQMAPCGSNQRLSNEIEYLGNRGPRRHNNSA